MTLNGTRASHPIVFIRAFPALVPRQHKLYCSVIVSLKLFSDFSNLDFIVFLFLKLE